MADTTPEKPIDYDTDSGDEYEDDSEDEELAQKVAARMSEKTQTNNDEANYINVPLYYGGFYRQTPMTFKRFHEDVCLFSGNFMLKSQLPPFPDNRPTMIYNITNEDFNLCVELIDEWMGKYLKVDNIQQ